MPAPRHKTPRPVSPEADALAQAEAWLRTRQNPGRARPDYRRWFSLAETLHLQKGWQILNIARWLKTAHEPAKTALATVTLNALNKALSRHLSKRRADLRVCPDPAQN